MRVGAVEKTLRPERSTRSAKPRKLPRSKMRGRAAGATEKPPGTGRFPLFVMAVVVLGAISLSLGLFKEFGSVLAPTFLAVNLVITAYPAYRWLEKHRVPRALAALITGVILALVLILATSAIVWAGTSMVSSLTSYGPQFTELYTQLITWLSTLGFDEAALLEQLKSVSPSNVLGLVGNVVSQVSSTTTTLIVVLICLAFLVADLPSIAKRLAITDRLHPSFTDSLAGFALGIRRYWLVTSLFGLIVAILDGIALMIVGVSLPLVWAVLSFITNYIPNVGFFIGLLPPALLALLEKGPTAALIVVIAYCALNFVIQTVIQPKFTGDAVGITPVVSFISLLLWTAVFGPLGALLALPLTLMVKSLLLDNDPRARWVGALISSDPDSVDTSDCDDSGVGVATE